MFNVSTSKFEIFEIVMYSVINNNEQEFSSKNEAHRARV